MKTINFFYHINLGNQSAGGIINFLRGLIMALEVSTPIKYYSLHYTNDLMINKENLDEIFLENMTNNPNEKIKKSNNLVYMLELLKFFKQEKFSEDDLLIFNRSDHALVSFIRRLKGKKILIVHGSTKYDKFYYKHSLIKRIFSKIAEHIVIKKFDRIIAVSEEAFEYYKELYPGLINKFEYIPTFVDQSVFKEKDYKSLNQAAELSFIYYGRFVEEKGIYHIKDFFDYLDSQEINFKALLIGEGELENIFHDQDSVEIINALPQKAIVKYLHKKTILLMFSECEGTPLTLLESLATGTPALCSNVGGMSNVIKNGRNGFLFDNVTKEYPKIAKRATEIIENYSYYSYESIQSIKEYSLKQVTKQYQNLIQEFSYPKEVKK
jgi:glycosyltransferase involved in cell wall biosynthesis